MSTNRNEYDRLYYQKNRERRKAQIRSRNSLACDRNRDSLREYLSDRKCVDCGYSDIRALQFDHRNPESKRLEISSMVSGSYSWDTILEEIEKCDVVCANCHSIRTCESRGYHKNAGLA